MWIAFSHVVAQDTTRRRIQNPNRRYVNSTRPLPRPAVPIPVPAPVPAESGQANPLEPFPLNILIYSLSASSLALPLFNLTRTFTRHLELFDACCYVPTAGHRLVRAWCAEEGEEKGEEAGFGGEGGGGGSSGTSGSGSGRYGKKGDPSKDGSGATNLDMGAVAARALSDTGLDVEAFEDALAQIQMHHDANFGVGRC